MNYFTDAEKKTVWWYDNDANAPDGLVKIDEAEAMAIANPPPAAEQKAAAIRTERDARLKKTDLIIIRCAEAGEPVPEAWKAYRQVLRDVPEQAGFPDTVVWPEQPEGGIKQKADSGQAAVAEDITETEEDTVGQQPA